MATWNLERGGKTKAAHAAQQAALESNLVRADVLVLTESPPPVVAVAGTVTSPADVHGSWVAIQGKHVQPVDLPIPCD